MRACQASTEQDLKALVRNEEDLRDQERPYQLFDIMWAWQMEHYPEFATYTGYPRPNDRWTDYSLEAIERRKAQAPRFLQALDTIDQDALDERARLDYDLVRKTLEEDIEGQRFNDEVMPLNQMDGVQQEVPRVIAMMQTTTAAAYEDVIARLRGVPRLIDQTIVLLEDGRKAGLTPPRISLRDVPRQIQNLLVEEVASNPMLAAFQRFPETIPSAKQERLQEEAMQVMIEDVYPAYRTLHDYLVETYIPQVRTSIGLSELPEGGALVCIQRTSAHHH